MFSPRTTRCWPIPPAGRSPALFASDSDTLGYKAYGVSKPGALLLGYPVNNFFELKPVWGLLIDPYADGPAISTTMFPITSHRITRPSTIGMAKTM